MFFSKPSTVKNEKFPIFEINLTQNRLPSTFLWHKPWRFLMPGVFGMCGSGKGIKFMETLCKKKLTKLSNLQGEDRKQKIEAPKSNWWVNKVCWKEMKGVWIHASYSIAKFVAKSARPFIEGEIVKDCMMEACDVLCPEAKDAFTNRSLSRATIQ